MNTEKKSGGIVIAIIAVIIVAGIIWYGSSSNPKISVDSLNSTTTVPIAVSETTRVSNSLSEYQNAELGFLIKYPSVWEKEETNSGVNFIIPVDKAQVSTVATLQTNVQVLSATCAFPAVTTVKDRSTLKINDMNFNTISMSNTVQGRTYFDRMYSLQKERICYMFRLSSITQPISSKNLTGSQATQATNNNKAIINMADTAFTDMVKSFAFVTELQGIDETKAAPAQ